MSVSTRVILQGKVVASSTRSGVSLKDPANPKPWSFDTVFIIGEHTVAEAQLGDGVAAIPVGSTVTAVAQLGVYAGDDSVTLVQLLASDAGGK